MTPRALRGLLVWFLVWAPVRAPLAQSEAESPAKSLELEGERFFKAKRYEEAANLFREVIERYAEPEDLVLTARWNLARCFEEMGEDEKALEAFSEFEKHAKSEEHRSKARAKIAKLREKIRAELTLEVEPAGTVIRLDGEVIGNAPLGKSISLDPGRHFLELYKEGYRTLRESIDINPKEHALLRFALQLKQGKVLVRSEDPDLGVCTLFLDGAERFAGRLPLETVLPAGPHHIRVVAQGEKEPFEKEIDVPDGGVVEVVVRFQKPLRPEVPKVVTKAPAPTFPAEEQEVRVSASLTAGIGLMRYQGTTSRTHANLEVGIGITHPRLPWLSPELSVMTSVETPIMAIIRPAIHIYPFSPLFFRIGGQFMVTPLRAGGALIGLGVVYSLSEHFSVLVEADTSVWPSAIRIFSADLRVGGRYAF